MTEYEKIKRRLDNKVTLQLGDQKVTVLQEDADMVLQAYEQAQRQIRAAIKMNNELNKKLFPEYYIRNRRKFMRLKKAGLIHKLYK